MIPKPKLHYITSEEHGRIAPLFAKKDIIYPNSRNIRCFTSDYRELTIFDKDCRLGDISEFAPKNKKLWEIYEATIAQLEICRLKEE